MTLRTLAAALLAFVILVPVDNPEVRAEIQLPKASKTNADERTLAEFSTFYERIENALRTEDIDTLMSFYAEDYLHHGITKKQLRFMWLEIFSNFSDLYSVHVFSKITVHGGDAILVCTGALLGIGPGEEDYQAVDRWVNQDHWLTRVDDEWKMIGGATHQAPALGSTRQLEIHPLF